MDENDKALVVQTGPLVMRGEMALDDTRERLADFVERIKLMDEVVDKLMDEGTDYGKIPGVNKPCLLQPGMDKLNAFFGFVPNYETIERNLDTETGLYFVTYRCVLTHRESGVKVGEGIGSCTNREPKYYYRQGERKCPRCGKPTIKRSKYPPKNDPGAPLGWYCFGKIGGCGENYGANDPAIVDQSTGRVPNPDLADTINTVDKMAQKRAKGSAVNSATGLTRKYTVDAEDSPRPHDDGQDDRTSSHEDENAATGSQGAAKANGKPVMLDKETREIFAGRVTALTPDSTDKSRAALIAKVGKASIKGYSDWRSLTVEQLDPLLEAIKVETEKGA